MSENMPSHSFVARYPNYVQDASSTCVCGEIRDSSVHPDRFDDERVKEIIRRREKARQVAAEKGWMAAEVPTWSEVDYLLSLLPVHDIDSEGYRTRWCEHCKTNHKYFTGRVSNTLSGEGRPATNPEHEGNTSLSTSDSPSTVPCPCRQHGGGGVDGSKESL